MKGRLIALLTDFGTRDPYVPAMKGVIYSLCAGAVITDLTHDIPRHDTRSAAFHLLSVSPHFPPGTIFVCVVDPGVGTDRRILILKRGGHHFIAPDNGMLNYLVEESLQMRCYVLRYSKDSRKISPTFHGRDLFAPAAARLAGGTPITTIATATPMLSPVKLFNDIPARINRPVTGQVLHVDHFGNIITNLKPSPGHTPLKARLTIRKKTINMWADTYALGPARKPFILTGSTGLLEISLRNANAADTLGVRPGDRVVIR